MGTACARHIPGEMYTSYKNGPGLIGGCIYDVAGNPFIITYGKRVKV